MNEKNTIFCASCKHWTTSEPYYDERAVSEDDPDGIVTYPICGNSKAKRYNDYAPCDCHMKGKKNEQSSINQHKARMVQVN